MAKRKRRGRKFVKRPTQAEAFVSQYADIDFEALSDDELDKKIVEIGRFSIGHYTTKVGDLLHSCESIRQKRHEGEEFRLSEEEKAKIENLNSMLEKFIKDVYHRTLNSAKSIKKRMDEENKKEGSCSLTAKIYPAVFDEKLNKYRGEGLYSDGLLDVLMPIMMLLDMFCNLDFYIEPGKEIQCTKLDDMVKRVKYNDAVELVYPLALLVNFSYLTVKDLLGIKTFEYELCDSDW